MTLHAYPLFLCKLLLIDMIDRICLLQALCNVILKTADFIFLFTPMLTNLFLTVTAFYVNLLSFLFMN